MWPVSFEGRLRSWTALRTQIQSLNSNAALLAINSWWYAAPWRPYYLHWDDRPTWPDPWQLLNENIYCDVARGLGILYTIALADHPDIQDAQLVLTQDNGTLVQVGAGKYILNWEPDSIVNTSLSFQIARSIAQHQIKQKYN
jgi:hypothetical protein